MKYPSEVPSLGELALKYGTINSRQFDRLGEMHNKTGFSFADLMGQEQMATGYQINLLQLIYEFLVVKHQGKKFGQIAVNKGFVTAKQVDAALKKQLQQFRQEKLKRMIGDILVESGVITAEQREIIAAEQRRSELENPILKKGRGNLEELNLSDEEHRFLVIQNLDKTFAAMVIKKGFATRNQVTLAMDGQRRAFKNLRELNTLGDVMVDMGFLTPGQRDLILEEQQRMGQAEKQPEDQAATHGISENVINVTVSLDAMEAWADISDTKASPPSLAMLKAAMEKEEIVHGILKDEVLNFHQGFVINESTFF